MSKEKSAGIHDGRPEDPVSGPFLELYVRVGYMPTAGSYVVP